MSAFTSRHSESVKLSTTSYNPSFQAQVPSSLNPHFLLRLSILICSILKQCFNVYTGVSLLCSILLYSDYPGPPHLDAELIAVLYRRASPRPASGGTRHSTHESNTSRQRVPSSSGARRKWTRVQGLRISRGCPVCLGRLALTHTVNLEPQIQEAYSHASRPALALTRRGVPPPA